MTIFFASHDITLRRKRNTSGIKWAFSATFTAYNADIQPIEQTRIAQAGGRIGKTYECWLDSTVPVKEGDQIVSSGNTYDVTGVSTHSGAGLLDHKYLILIGRD